MNKVFIGTKGYITIRQATMNDIDRIMEIFCHARKYMAASGNPNQWIDGYPQLSLISHEIRQGHCHVCENSDRKVVATFCLSSGPDPTYKNIYNGKWLNDEPYSVIHRMASDGCIKGIGKACIKWCADICKNLRIDTHADNHIMQSLAKRCGFVECGIIHVANGSSRIAYQYVNA